MKKDEIAKIEQSLLVILPDHYKNFLLHYPEELRELNFHKEFFSEDSDWLIEINQLLSKGAIPKDLYAIGMDFGGNFFFIKKTDLDETVYYFDHEDASELDSDEFYWDNILRPDHKSLNEFKKWLVDFYGDTVKSLTGPNL